MKTSAASLALTLLSIAGFSGGASAQSAKELAGTYTLVSLVNMSADGKTFGTDPKGMMIFGPDGHYVQLITRSGLAPFASKSRIQTTAEENKAVVEGSISHFGTYSIDESSKALIFHIQTSTFPNWNGVEQKRPFTLKGDELAYKIPTAASGTGSTEAVWKRAK